MALLYIECIRARDAANACGFPLCLTSELESFAIMATDQRRVEFARVGASITPACIGFPIGAEKIQACTPGTMPENDLHAYVKTCVRSAVELLARYTL